MTGTRRKLLVYSTPVAVVVLLFAAKLISMVLAGNAAVSHFAASDGAGLDRDAGLLGTVNIIEPAKAHFVAGTAAAVQGRLGDADREFATALQRTEHEQSCPVRVNLALVREVQGDEAASTFQARTAVDRYRAAQQVIEQAPADCRDEHVESLTRLDAKIAAVATPPPPLAPPPAPPTVVPVAPAPGGTAPEDPRYRLHPGQGDPSEQLRQILRDAAR